MKNDLTPSERQAINKLIRAECCNYYDGTCLNEYPCKQLDADHIACKWFSECVLPSDKLLCSRLSASDIEPSADVDGSFSIVKYCTQCGNQYFPNSNRAKYCPECAKSVRRSQKAASASKRKG